MSITKSKFKQTKIGEIPEDWELKQLQDVAKFTNGYAFSSKSYVDVKYEAVPIFKMGNINIGGGLKITGKEDYSSRDIAKQLGNYITKKGDILMCMTDMKSSMNLLGHSAQIHDEKFLVNQRVGIIRYGSHVDGDYLYYFLNSPDYIKTIRTTARSGVQVNLTTEAIRESWIIYPPISEQQQIASILSSLDDKIELNRKLNKTLENMAKALFKHWFVENADKDGEMTKIGQVVEVKGGTTPSTTESEYWEGDIHWTSPRDLSNKKSIFLTTTERKITKNGLAVIGSGLLPIGTVLLSSRAPIGYLAITDIPVAINQGYIAILSNKVVSNYYVYFWLQNNMDKIISSANGSTFLEISKSNFKQLDFLKPPDEKLAKFDLIVGPIFSEIRINEYEMQSLSLIRDSLLPKLMSGRIRV